MIEMYRLKKININYIIKNKYNINIDKEDEKDFLIQQQGNALFRQIELLRGYKTTNIDELIFVESKNKSKNEQLIHILKNGFYCNSIKFLRIGKSASQAKNGITVFISEDYFKSITERSQLGITPKSCVISKYEAYRNLILSACEIVDSPLPYIIIVDDYEKVLPNQYVRYVSTEPDEFEDEDGKKIKYDKKLVKEGLHDVKISPFDGMGCHTEKISKLWKEAIGLKHDAISFQIRLPFMKGMSTQAPIQEYYKDMKVTKIKDIFGTYHDVEKIDCIWTKSMWKGYSIFKDRFGKKGWNEYLNRVNEYKFQLGISKYNHNIKDIDLYSRQNFQYLQCHDFLNNKYVEWFNSKDKNKGKFDFSKEDNKSKLIKLAEYSTDLFEKIIKGDKLYTLKYLGITETNSLKDINSNYIKAIMINDNMLQDICIKKTLIRMLRKSINQLKFGKIYSNGFYHIAVGDIIGFLQYCGGLDVKGCIGAKEIYCKTLPKGECVSLRSPLIDPSEVNKVNITSNELTDKYLDYFKENNIVMFSMYDISLPQQGGMDVDGDLVNLCKEKLLIDSVIEYPIIVDMTDKATDVAKDYTLENIVEYECNTRDNRIGEITNVATSILNVVTDNEKYRQKNKDDIAILRITQGKEIDFIKTSTRWHISQSLRKRNKKIPYFLLYSYPKKLKVYNNIKNINKDIESEEDKLPYNAYRSSSPMNELCDYILQWERDLIWNYEVIDTSSFLINKDIPTDNLHIEKMLTKIYKNFIYEFYSIIDNEDKNNKDEQDLTNSNGEIDKDDTDSQLDILFEKYRSIINEIPLEKKVITNYLVKICYKFKNRDKVFCWSMCGDTMLENLKNNSKNNPQKIVETSKEDRNSKEYLGRWYKLVDVNEEGTDE